MGDDLRKVRPGDPLRIPARAYNAFVDAALDARRRQQDRRGGELWDGGRSFIGGGVVAVRNDSGADLERYHALAIDGPLFLPGEDGPEKSFQNRLAFKGITPTDATRLGSFAIAREPIPRGEVGLCVVHGVTPARVLIEDEEHAFAEVAPDETVLASRPWGSAAILWKEAGVGEKWALVEAGRARTGPFVPAAVTMVYGADGDDVGDVRYDAEAVDADAAPPAAFVLPVYGRPFGTPARLARTARVGELCLIVRTPGESGFRTDLWMLTERYATALCDEPGT